ncbi:MAG: hypothetical protein J6W46_06845, partial [Spirochaetaceae bacterium]|nr:hypothetical protein [Spirochaetaceae bacterium]
MKHRNLTVFSVLIAFAFISCCSYKNVPAVQKKNWNTNYTYVFVHGLSGWGHYDSQNNLFPYWGLSSGSLLK